MSILLILEANSYPPLPNIQIRGDSTGGQGLGYPLLILTKYLVIFYFKFFSLKYLYLIYSCFFDIILFLYKKNIR